MKKLIAAIVLVLMPISANAEQLQTVRIYAGIDGRPKTFGSGSGTIISGKEGLILSCGHIFDSPYDAVYVDVFDLSKAGQVKALYRLKGKVALIKRQDDLSLVTVPPDRLIKVRQVIVKGDYKFTRNQRLFSWGCRYGADPSGFMCNLVATTSAGDPETSRVAAQGRSGGGLYNLNGTLVAVLVTVDPLITKTTQYKGPRRISSLLADYRNRKVASKSNTRRIVRPVMYAFMSQGCAPCQQFKRDQDRGHFRNVEVVTLTYGTQEFTDRWREMQAAVTASQRQRQIVTPVFWIKGTNRVKTGYSGPTSVLGWIGGFVKGFLALVFGHGGGSGGQPPGPPPLGTHGLGETTPVPSHESETDPNGAEPSPVPTELVVEEVDWSDVTVVALASIAVPRASALLAGPAERGLKSISKGKAVLHVVAQRTRPLGFAAIERAAGINTSLFPLYVLVLIERQDVGLVKGIVTKKIETQVLDKLSAAGGKIPVELIFRRIDRTVYDQIRSALTVIEAVQSVDNSLTPVEREPLWVKLLHRRLEASDSKAANMLKTVIALKSTVDRVSSKVHEPTESPKRYERKDIDELAKSIKSEPVWAKAFTKRVDTKIEKSDSKTLVILKELGFIKMAQDKFVGKLVDVVPSYDLSESGFPLKKATLLSVLGFGAAQLVMGRRRKKKGASEVALDATFQATTAS